MTLTSEILEQPSVVERLLVSAPPELQSIVRASRRARADHVLVAARGSSDHAAVYAQYALGSVARLPVALATPSLFSRYGRPPRIGRALVVGISQSGQSPDVVEVIAEARRQGAPTLAITNDPASPLADAAATVIDLGAGQERSVAATKTYTAQLVTIAMLAAALGDAEAEHQRHLRQLPDMMASALAGDDVDATAADLVGMDECVVVGRGFNLATALEWALKLKELAGVRAHAYSAADYRHGPIASFGPGAHLIGVAAAGPLLGDVVELVQRLEQDRGAVSLLLSGDRRTTGRWLAFPDRLPEVLSPIVAILPAQRLAAQLAELRGRDVERPIGLSKVTLTR
jgi:glucosamine--fructose-6-phosphate aminotransferase (isomerizing)